MEFDAGEVNLKSYDLSYQTALDECCKLENAFILGMLGQ